MELYSLIFSQSVVEQLEAIETYIEEHYFSKQAGKSVVNNILLGLERLESFPSVGFNADERVGKVIYPPYATRCIVLGEYLAFYQVLEERKAVFISDLLHAKQDYIKLFKK